MADEETNKLVDDLEDEEKAKKVDVEPEPDPEPTPAEPEPVADEVANPPVEDVSEAVSIEEVMALVKQLQAQVDALSTIQPEPEPEPEPQPQQPEEQPLQEPKQDDPDEIEKLLDL